MLPLVVATRRSNAAHGIMFSMCNRTFMCMKGDLDSETDYQGLPDQSATELQTSHVVIKDLLICDRRRALLGGERWREMALTLTRWRGVNEDEPVGLLMVQTIMELGSDSEEDLPSTPLVNEEAHSILDEILATVGRLWDRGDETTAQALASSPLSAL